MQKVAKRMSRVMSRILLLGFGVQILAGVAFIVSHMGSRQEFPESLFLTGVSATLLCDEYTGILYPLLIRIFQGIAFLVPIPYFSMLYILQLGVAAGAGFFFLGALRSFRGQSVPVRLWAVLSLVTMPMAAQCHMAVLPVSLTTSLFLCQLGLFWRACREERKGLHPFRYLALMGGCCLLMGLLVPEYRLFGAILPVSYAAFEILSCGGEVKKIAGITLLTAAFLGLAAQAHALTVREGAYGRMQDTPEAAAFRRFAWDDFGEFYSDWPSELVEALTQEEIYVCNRYPLQKEWILGQRVDAVYGRERAREIYGQVALLTAKARLFRNGKEILKDMLCYGFAPPMQLWLMAGGNHATLSGRNFDVMRERAPLLTTFYVRYGYGWFLAAWVIALFLELSRLGKNPGKRGESLKVPGGKRRESLKVPGGKRRERSRFRWGLRVTAAVSLLIVIWYTMQGGGIMDYKNSLSVTLLWGAWMCRNAMRTQ